MLARPPLLPASSGQLAATLQRSFVENWLENKGEILAEREDFAYCRAQDSDPSVGDTRGLVVTSASSAGKATPCPYSVSASARVRA